jgi:hypothetical protein
LSRKRHIRAPEVQPERSGRLAYILAAAAALIALWAYLPSLHGRFLFDDMYLPGETATLIASLRGVRPVLMFTYWMSARISGQDPFGYHLFNFGLHCVNCALILLVVRRVLQLAGIEEPRRKILAGLAALVFLLHPAQTEAIAYVTGRSEALSSFLFFLAFAVFLCRPEPAIAWGRSLIVLALFGMAVLSKEQTIVLPALLLLTDFWWDPGFSLRGVGRNWRVYTLLSFGVAGAVVFLWDLIAHATSAGFALEAFTWVQYFYTQWRALFVYLFTFLLPVNLTLDRDFPISQTPLDHGAIAGLAALVFLGVVAWRNRRRFRLAGYGFFVFLAMMAPTSSILPILDPVAEHRLYFSMIGLLLIVVDLLSRLRWRRVWAFTAAGTFALAAALATHARASLWANPIALWEDTVRKSPLKARPHFQLGSAYYEAGQCDRAAAEFERTAQLQKPNSDLLVDWGLACDCQNLPELALSKLRQAAALEASAHVYSQIAKVYAERSRWAEAMDALATAQQLDANLAIIYYYRGKVYLSTGQPALAVPEYRHALALEPTLREAAWELSEATAAVAGKH